MPDASAPVVRPLRPAARVAVVVAVAVIGAVYVVLAGRPASSWVYACGTSVAAGAGWFGYRRHRPEAGAAGWRWVLAGLALYALGDGLWALALQLAGEVPAVSIADVAYMAAYVALIVGVLRLGAARLGARSAESIADALSLAGVLVVVLWSPVIAPVYAGAPLLHQIVLAFYPCADMVLVAITVRFAAVHRARSGVAVTMAGAAVLLLVSDIAYAVAIRHGWYDRGFAWLDLLYLTSLTLWSALFCAPTLRAAGQRVVIDDAAVTTGRLTLSGIGLLAAPVTTVVLERVGRQRHEVVSLASSVVVTAAVLWRLRRATRSGVLARDHAAGQHRYFRELAQHASDVVLVVSVDGRIVDVAGSSTELYGRDRDGVLRASASDLVHPDDRTRCRELFHLALTSSGLVLKDEFRVLRRDGSVRWLSVRMRHSAAIDAVVLNVSDVSDRKHAEVALSHQALHDGLTGLANRVLLEERIAHALTRRGHQIALLYLDLDRFKIVNDSLGHAAGDRLLVELAARLTATVRAADTVARLGGDEFAILLEEPAGTDNALESACRVAERILAMVALPVNVGTVEVVVGTSIGVTLAAEGEAAGAVLRHGDLALYAAKMRGKGCYAVFDAGMQTAASDRLELETDLRFAVARDELVVEFQPVVVLDTLEVRGFEALVRWDHPTRGRLGPGTFIPIAEESGLIGEIGQHVLRRACATAAAWPERPDGEAYSVSVNLSAAQLSDSSMVAAVGHALATSGLAARRLVLELTESSLILDPIVAKARLQAVRALGVRVAIDDFGTGYSSLAYLREFPIDILKLDRSFLVDRAAEPQQALLVHGVLELGHALGLHTIAEGIETATQWAWLTSLGCQLGQGYLFGWPAPVAALDDVLRTGRVPHPVPLAVRPRG